MYRASSEDQAVAIANDTPFGLGSYVFTTDPEQAQRVANRIEAGMVFVNGVGADGAELPFGGIKRSGFGRELGRFGMEAVRCWGSRPSLPAIPCRPAWGCWWPPWA
ncbi:succinate-semialdehyde dehydrogenase [NADP(+)] [Mycobacteroides abscessus subsp. abscessus]|nr:succinate-semialdehyde dehydrogenase [NADP(+)] [Mycobacteroides abscessus subsp. abscessus]